MQIRKLETCVGLFDVAVVSVILVVRVDRFENTAWVVFGQSFGLNELPNIHRLQLHFLVLLCRLLLTLLGHSDVRVDPNWRHVDYPSVAHELPAHTMLVTRYILLSSLQHYIHNPSFVSLQLFQSIFGAHVRLILKPRAFS